MISPKFHKNNNYKQCENMEIIQSLWELIITGSPNALIAFLFAGNLYFIWEKRKIEERESKMQEELNESKKEYFQSIEKIVDRYYKGNIEIIQALHEIQIVLSTMQKTM